MFKNPQTAEQFESVPGFEYDQMIHFPGKFSKMKSDLLPQEAKDLVDNGVNYIRPLAQSTVPPAESLIEVDNTTIVEKKSESVNQD